MLTRRQYLQLSTLGVTGFTRAQAPQGAQVTISDDRPTILMADAATLAGNLRRWPAKSSADRFHVSHWTLPGDSFTWKLNAANAGEYSVVALVRGSGAIVQLASDRARTPPAAPVHSGWDRVELGALKLAQGVQSLTLSSTQPGSGLELYSLELATPKLTSRLAKQARAARSDTSWMRKAKYGLQFHWTSQSQPRSGPRKPYAEASRDFPARAFAEAVHESGAGYVILTTSHAEYFFPAPIAAIDAIMPGRTARRDLIRDLIEELGRFGIRLMLYYHAGHDHWREPNGWWVRCGHDARNPEKFLANWCSIIGEVGHRYGSGLAGWFFDDSRVYYPLNPEFRRLAIAAKAGNPSRVICYNPWIWPRCTDFQDYFCGEGYGFLKVRDNLPADGSGIFSNGPQRGLQAHTNFILESDWCHSKPETAIPLPTIPKEAFISDVSSAIARGIVPSINLEIYQDGGVGPASIEYLAALKAALVTP